MTKAIIFLCAWVLALFLGYKFANFNIKHTQKHSKEYFDHLK